MRRDGGSVATGTEQLLQSLFESGVRTAPWRLVLRCHSYVPIVEQVVVIALLRRFAGKDSGELLAYAGGLLAQAQPSAQTGISVAEVVRVVRFALALETSIGDVPRDRAFDITILLICDLVPRQHPELGDIIEAAVSRYARRRRSRWWLPRVGRLRRLRRASGLGPVCGREARVLRTPMAGILYSFLVDPPGSSVTSAPLEVPRDTLVLDQALARFVSNRFPTGASSAEVDAFVGLVARRFEHDIDFPQTDARDMMRWSLRMAAPSVDRNMVVAAMLMSSAADEVGMLPVEVHQFLVEVETQVLGPDLSQS